MLAEGISPEAEGKVTAVEGIRAVQVAADGINSGLMES
ncbi:hypothetical protein KP77_10530 [Jeotgalibacillus alimentarius]|uniref:Uncharacterized protein n=1 Tax=Jeotgalibacillus alimentarius TaxID=135826 RepID=A0A0C2W4N2_9BACL|nr:hypothetical protein KP77_10530 [Jeotgalibacillus alimentarius]